ncbi:hypothetical protein Glove_508g31 [Diversispora epigaea]|uniref:Uncharacterized protein n=1 Tax=Diversispora epigaea TaxID=1348612 RepID=A0A397GPP3_9GLOM|nr:hypothetical protein Glove_508g31 [Diversispora epigaea]
MNMNRLLNKPISSIQLINGKPLLKFFKKAVALKCISLNDLNDKSILDNLINEVEIFNEIGEKKTSDISLNNIVKRKKRLGTLLKYKEIYTVVKNLSEIIISDINVETETYQMYSHNLTDETFWIYSKVSDGGSLLALNEITYGYWKKAFELFLESAEKGNLV